ncbi:MAG TPA: glycosyltransferase family 39 protein, partial [Rhodanobacteraceae bacterium]|nr:glycosyltransferase family 39 protein [Rhodanobacteraceae bacterium]
MTSLSRVLEWTSLLAVAVLLVAASTKLAVWTATQPVSFDGAMNLEVARSLAEGAGYRRMYADHLGFSHAIQTRAPYILPAAAVFAAFGVGVWQSQLVNALYLVAFSLLVFVLVMRVASWRWALAAVAMCLCTPGLDDNGLNGFGEVPALTWWLAALAVLYGARDAGPPSARRYFVAGLLLGIAIVTKTVLLIGVAAAALVLFAEAAQRERRWRPLAALIGIVGAGVLLPVLLHEVCRALAFGDWVRWRAWIGDEWRMIHMQAGTRVGFPDSADVASKVHSHFIVLADGLGIRHGIVAAWLLLPAILLLGSWRTWTSTRARALIA